ncbi:hypothetical protein EC991_008229 [Linnemannia zychae]|nr:hypothetical protein EC991_008229 [Linnemannia zychae]
MSGILAVYKDLLASNEGDILVKLKDGKQLKIISFLVKKRSSVFKAMLESPMKEGGTGVVDLSTQYSLEAFREFLAYIYYNKQYAGSYLPLLFEILSIADYYEVDAYRIYISDKITALITNVPICLVIASEALKYGTLTDKIYIRCLKLLVEAVESQDCSGFLLETTTPKTQECYDTFSGDTRAWCCSSHSTKSKTTSKTNKAVSYIVNGQVACIESTIRRSLGYHTGIMGNPERCCMHQRQMVLNIDDLPAFIGRCQIGYGGLCRAVCVVAKNRVFI